MHRFFLALTVMLTALALQLPHAAADDQLIKQEIMRLEQELRKALLSKDAAVFERIFAPGFVNTTPSGEIIDKKTDIAGVRSGALNFTSSENYDMRVDVYNGNTAIATYASNEKFTFNGRDLSGRYRQTDVFVLIDGQCRLVAQHVSRVSG